MTKEEFITERTRIISEMLDNPDKYGLYPTTRCFTELDLLYGKIIFSLKSQLSEANEYTFNGDRCSEFYCNGDRCSEFYCNGDRCSEFYCNECDAGGRQPRQRDNN